MMRMEKVKFIFSQAAGLFSLVMNPTVKKVNKTPTKTNPRHPFFWDITLPETNIFAAENGWFEDDRFLLGWPIFQVRTVNFRE